MGIRFTWKCGIAAGAGVVVGLLGAVLFSRGRANPKKFCAAIPGQCTNIMDRASATAETAKENIGDVAAGTKRQQARSKEQAQGS